MSEPIRLSKRLIELTGCSRREAELYIEGGWVSIDGEVVEEPQFKVSEQQAVVLLPGAEARPLEPATVLLNQPADFKGDADDLLTLFQPQSRWAEDPSGVRALRGHLLRLQASLPLQPHAEGMLVFSQDWRTLRKLTDDAYKLEQEYVVEVIGELPPSGLETLKRGQTIKGESLPGCKVSWQNETRLRFALKNPSPGVIQRLCDSVGLRVVSIKRIRIGGVSMGKLPTGQWRYLSPQERF